MKVRKISLKNTLVKILVREVKNITKLMFICRKNLSFVINFIFVASVFALSLAYIAQYFFHLYPCQLCLWQRKPYFVAIILGILFFITYHLRLKIIDFHKYQFCFLFLMTLCMLAVSILAFYHAGVEYGLLSGFSSCVQKDASPASLEEMIDIVINSNAVRCDEAAFTFMGISMAGYNFLYSAILFIIGLFSLIKRGKV